MALFSAALGLAGSIYGANKAAKLQSAALAQQRYEFERTRELQNANLAIAEQARQQQYEENQYQRQMERLNRRIAGQERQYQLDELSSYRDQLMAERRETIERQIIEDKAAAEQRQFQLEQYLQNRDLAQEERDFAIQQLNEAKAVASGERDEDKRRLLEDRARAEIERDFLISEYQNAQGQYAQERADQVAFRDMLMSRLDGVRDSTQAFAEAQGYIPEIQQITDREINAEINRRTDQYQSDVDRAAEKVISMTEGDLYRRGMQDSTIANRTRGDVAGRLADEYETARSRAYDDAMKYISGKQTMMATDVNNIMNRRKYLVDENTNLETLGLNQMMQMPSMVGSATGGYGLMSSIPSGIYDRALSSANDYTAPVSIGTGIYDANYMNIGNGLAGYMNPQSAASNAFFNVGSSVFNPYGVTVDNPTNYTQMAGTLAGNILSGANGNVDRAMQVSADAGKGLGTSFAKFTQEAETWWSNRNAED